MKTHRAEHVLNLIALPLALYALLALLTACAWSVPADPGENERVRGDPSPGRAGLASVHTDDPDARRLYLEHCGRCHAPWPTTHLRASEWPHFVRRYAPRAGLFGVDRQRVLEYLQANAR